MRFQAWVASGTGWMCDSKVSSSVSCSARMAAGFAAFMSEAVIHAWTFACMWGHRTGRL